MLDKLSLRFYRIRVIVINSKSVVNTIYSSEIGLSDHFKNISNIFFGNSKKFPYSNIIILYFFHDIQGNFSFCIVCLSTHVFCGKKN